MIYWNSFADFLAMGGYGFYVWASFGVTALIMGSEPIVVARRRPAAVAGGRLSVGVAVSQF